MLRSDTKKTIFTNTGESMCRSKRKSHSQLDYAQPHLIPCKDSELPHKRQPVYKHGLQTPQKRKKENETIFENPTQMLIFVHSIIY